MVAKLLINFEQPMQKGLINNQSSGFDAFTKQIISLAVLTADSLYKNELENLVCARFQNLVFISFLFSSYFFSI